MIPYPTKYTPISHPGKIARRSEQLLIEVVAPTPHRLSQWQARSQRVEKVRDADLPTTGIDQEGDGSRGEPAKQRHLVWAIGTTDVIDVACATPAAIEQIAVLIWAPYQ